MYFGDIPIDQAAGAILAHSRQVAGKRFKKGRVLSAEDIAALREDGVRSVTAARLESDDVAEDEAAARIASALAGSGITVGSAFTGRCNLFAVGDAVAQISRACVDEINLVSEEVTIATAPEFSIVSDRQMVATIKIIPFAVNADVLERCLAIAGRYANGIQTFPLRGIKTVLIQTELPGTSQKMLDKTSAVMARRLESLNSTIEAELRCEHTVESLHGALAAPATAGADVVLIAGASAIVDRRDVIPAAIEASGGAIEHFGMPVDPGNLLLLGSLANKPVLGLPGCARSPKYNGLDAVIERLAAGISVHGADIMTMGVGGLLKEFAGRPVPRAGVDVSTAKAPHVTAIVLAAGQSRRMGEQNKLLAVIDGQPMVSHTLNAVSGARVQRLIVVTGFEAERIVQAVSGIDTHGQSLEIVHNAEFDQGLSTSLNAALGAVGSDTDAILVCLGDMPKVSSEDLNRLVAAFDPVEGREICIPTWMGKRGNPVLWSRRFVSEMRRIEGDTGARHLIGEHGEVVCEVPVGSDATLVDVDTPEALEAIRQQLSNAD